MEKQLNFTDIEYSRRRKKTKREEFLRKMDAVVPWELWVEQIRPYFPDGRRGRPPHEIEVMLSMLMKEKRSMLLTAGIYGSPSMKTFFTARMIFHLAARYTELPC